MPWCLILKKKNWLLPTYCHKSLNPHKAGCQKIRQGKFPFGFAMSVPAENIYKVCVPSAARRGGYITVRWKGGNWGGDNLSSKFGNPRTDKLTGGDFLDLVKGRCAFKTLSEAQRTLVSSQGPLTKRTQAIELSLQLQIPVSAILAFATCIDYELPGIDSYWHQQ